MATAIIQFKVNAGAVQTGTAEVFAEDTIDLLLASYSGLRSIRWEIQEYPAGFPEPSGWSTDGSSGAYYYNASPTAGLTPPTITLPTALEIAGGQWGKWIFRAIATTATGTIVSDPRCGVYIVSTSLEMVGLGFTEENEFNTQRAWPGDVKADLVKIDNAALAAGIPADALYLLKGTTVPAELVGGVAVGALTAQLTFENDSGSAIVPVKVSRIAAAGSTQEAFNVTREVTAAGAGTVGTGASIGWYTRNAAGSPALTLMGREAVALTAVSGANVTAGRTWSTVNAGVEAAKMFLAADGGLRLHAYTTESFLSTTGAGLGSVASIQPRVLCDGSTDLPSFGRDITNLTTTLGFQRALDIPATFTRLESTYNAVFEVLPVRLTLDAPGQVGNGPEITLYGWHDGEDYAPIGAVRSAMTNVGAGAFASTLGFSAATGAALVQVATLTGAGVLSAASGFDRMAAGALTIGALTATSVAITPATSVSGALTIGSSIDRIAAGALAIAPTTATSVAITPATSIAGALTVGSSIDRIAAGALTIAPSTATSVTITPATTVTATFTVKEGGTDLFKVDGSTGAVTQTVDGWVNSIKTTGNTIRVEADGSFSGTGTATVWSYVLPATFTGWIEFTVTMADITAANDHAMYRRTYEIQRRASGSVYLTEVGTAIEAETSDTSWDARIADSPAGTLILEVVRDATNQTDGGGRVTLELTTYTTV